MTRKAMALLLASLAAVMVVLLGGYLFLGYRHLTSRQPAAGNRNPIAVRMRLPSQGASYPSNGTVPVSIEIDSVDPIQLVQLWLDGEFVTDVIPSPQAGRLTIALPADLLAGDALHTLVVTAVDAGGRSAPGNAVRVQGSPPVPAEFIVTTSAGESLQSIADHFGLGLPRLLEGNARLLASGQVKDGLEALPAGLPVVVPLGEPSPVEPAPQGKQAHQISLATGLPEPPSIQLSAEGCQVHARIEGDSDMAEGYSLYRLDPDASAFEKIADLNADGGERALEFIDSSAYGHAEYFVSAYNQEGETLGPLTHVELQDPACRQGSDMSVSDGILHLPADVERAYLYAAINSGEFDRWPRQQGEFLVPQASAIDLHALTNSLVDSGLDSGYPFQLDLEVWGWSSGELRFLGEVSARLDGTRLAICNLDGGCSGDVGSTHYVAYARVGSDSTDQDRELRWNSSVPFNPTALFQLATQPFPAGYQADPAGLVYAELVSGSGSDGGSGGTFTVDFAHLEQAMAAVSLSARLNPGAVQAQPPLITNQGPPQGDPSYFGLAQDLGWQIPSMVDSSYFGALSSAAAVDAAGFPIIYYGRLVPLQGNIPSGPVSDTVTIEYRHLGPAPTVEVYSEYPPLAYTMAIRDFVPPLPPSLHWGCVDILAVDGDSWVWTMPYWASMKSSFVEAMNKGWAYCPTAYKGQGGGPWYKQLWSAIEDTLDWVAEAYETAKSEVIDQVAASLNAIPPGDLCGEKCQDWLKYGLEAGLAAMGIPPTLPDVNRLTDEGIAYLVEEGARQIGVDCGEACREILTEQLHALKDQVLAQQVASYGNTDEAHNHGYNPLPLPPEGLTVAPSQGNTWQMAYATLELTRTPESAAYSAQDLRKYRYQLRVGVRGHNEWMVGKSISVATAICYNDASMWPCDYKSDLVTEPLEGSLFGGGIPVPDLAPGQSMDVHVVLTPNHWWYADHEKYAGNTWPWDDDWWHLYSHGQGTMTATMTAEGVQFGGPVVLTVAEDGPWEFDLPDLDLQGMMAP